MIDPIFVLNSSNTHLPGALLGTLTPDGAGGYALSISMEWLHGVLHYLLQPVLLVLVLLVFLLVVQILFSAGVRR